MTHFFTRSLVPLAFAILLPACSDPTSGSQPSSSQLPSRPATYVRFVQPANGAIIKGRADLQIEANLGEVAATMTLLLDGQVIAAYDRIASAIKLDTTTLGDGTKVLGISATTQAGEVYTDTVSVTIDNPQHRLVSSENNQTAYGRGEKIKIKLDYTEANLQLEPDFSVMDSAFAKSRVEIEDQGAGQYEVRYTLSSTDDRTPLHYQVPITSVGHDSEPLISMVDVQFLGAPRLPLSVTAPSAVFSDQTIALATMQTAPVVESVVKPERLIQGQPSSITVKYSASAADPVDRILLGSPNASGTWVIPLSAPSTSGELVIPLEATGNPDRLTTSSIPISAAAVGISGATRACFLTDMEIITMNLFGLKFLLNWNSSADLDLEVTTPSGQKINYDHPAVELGKLETDSNAQCENLAPFPKESISWGTKDILPGQYRIRVSQFDSCGATDTKFSITILACGKSTSIPGVFSGSDGSTTQEFIPPPYVVDCLRRLHGRITFEKPSLGGTGYASAVGVPVRITGADLPVEITTTTGANGDYAVSIPATNNPTISMRVDATWAPPGETAPRAQVWSLTDDLPYNVTTQINNFTSQDLQYDLQIPEASNAGAFNILNVMRLASGWKDGFFDSSIANRIAPLVARWTRGLPTPAAGGGSYYWCRTMSYPCALDSKAIWIGGGPQNPSEFSDPTIAHEFSHHLASSLQIDNSPGGAHNFFWRLAPRFAWSEGFATAIGQHIVNQAIYWSGPLRAPQWVNVESTPQLSAQISTMDASLGMAYGTLPANDMAGQVNEFLVAGILYDLVDPANEPGNDEIGGTSRSVQRTLSYYLGKPNMVDRSANLIDLVDLLDGWRCNERRLQAASGIAYSDDKLGMLLTYRQFAYEPPVTDPICN